MKGTLLLLLLAAVLCPEAEANATAAMNVNSRYTVESVEITPRDRFRISDKLREALDKIVGEKFDQALTVELASRLRQELRATTVTHRVLKGEKPDHVKVVFEYEGRKRLDEETNVTKLAYHSKQGWTGGLEVSGNIGRDNRLTFGIQSDGDELLERYAGVNARFSKPIGDRVRVRFDFQSFHQQWNRATLEALDTRSDVPGIYRERQNYEPGVMVLVIPGLTWTAGASFQQFQTQFPAARTEAANAVVNTLRYRGRWNIGESSRQELDAAYSLRAATRIFESDFVYARHLLQASYGYGTGDHAAVVKFAAGGMSGTAPLFERFSIGNTTTLRGWNKFDIAPLGGDRELYGSVEYRYQDLMIFYDAGSVWDDVRDAQGRHSVGAGLHWDNISIALAFPIRGRPTPIFLVSANF